MNMITVAHTHSNKLSIKKLSLLNKLFKKSSESTSDNDLDIHQLQLATCILLIEVSKSDDDYDKAEQEKIISLIKEKFSLTDDEIEEVFSVSNNHHKKMISLKLCVIPLKYVNENIGIVCRIYIQTHRLPAETRPRNSRDILSA